MTTVINVKGGLYLRKCIQIFCKVFILKNFSSIIGTLDGSYWYLSRFVLRYNYNIIRVAKNYRDIKDLLNIIYFHGLIDDI